MSSLGPHNLALPDFLELGRIISWVFWGLHRDRESSQSGPGKFSSGLWWSIPEEAMPRPLTLETLSGSWCTVPALHSFGFGQVCGPAHPGDQSIAGTSQDVMVVATHTPAQSPHHPRLFALLPSYLPAQTRSQPLW